MARKISNLPEMKYKVVNVDGEDYELIPLISIGGGVAFDADSYTLKPVEKEITLEDIQGEMGEVYTQGSLPFSDANTLLLKMNAINDLLVVALYLNDGWTPDWNDSNKKKCSLYIDTRGDVNISYFMLISYSVVFFKSKELAQEAIRILGEDKIKLIYS